MFRSDPNFLWAKLASPVATMLLRCLGLVLLLNPATSDGAGFPTPSGKFTFDGKRYVGTATLTGTSITNGSLYLNGEYKWPTVVFRPLVLDYRRFTAVAKLCPENISHGVPLLVGGTAWRWFVISAGSDGKVEVSFNNHEFHHPIEGLTITNGQWTILAFTFDLQSKRAVVYADGKRTDEIVLPENFDLGVINDAKWKDSDKELTFTDCANGSSFRGLVAGLITFDSVLSPEQVRQLFPRK